MFDRLRKAITLIRKFNGIEKKQLAEALDVTPSYVTKIESGEKRPNIAFIDKFAASMGIKPSLVYFFAERLKDDFRDNLMIFCRYSDLWKEMEETPVKRP